MMAPNIAVSRQHLYIITYPRTASSLLMRILALPEQPNTLCEESGGYFFLPALVRMRELGLMERPYSEWTDEQRGELMKSFQNCFDKLHTHFEDARVTGQTAVVKEHCPFMIDPVALMKFGSTSEELSLVTDKPWKLKLSTPWDHATPCDLKDSLFSNDTILPDTFLMSWLPTFLIRHPIVVFPSYYRVFVSNSKRKPGQMQSVQGQMLRHMTLKWTRNLYDWYMSIWLRLGSESQKAPIILDADDILNSPQVIKKYCRLVGLDESKLQFSWEPLSQEELSKHTRFKRRMRDTLFASSGIQTDKIAANLNLDTELAKWNKEFGEEAGLRIRDWVVAALPDYTYLQSKRLIL